MTRVHQGTLFIILALASGCGSDGISGGDAPTAVIRGTVMTADGQAVAGASIGVKVVYPAISSTAYGDCRGQLINQASTTSDASGTYRVAVSSDITFAAQTCLHLEATPNTAGLLPATRSGITYTFGLSQDSIAVNFTIQRQ